MDSKSIWRLGFTPPLVLWLNLVKIPRFLEQFCFLPRHCTSTLPHLKHLFNPCSVFLRQSCLLNYISLVFRATQLSREEIFGNLYLSAWLQVSHIYPTLEFIICGVRRQTKTATNTDYFKGNPIYTQSSPVLPFGNGGKGFGILVAFSMNGQKMLVSYESCRCERLLYGRQPLRNAISMDSYKERQGFPGKLERHRLTSALHFGHTALNHSLAPLQCLSFPHIFSSSFLQKTQS